MNEYRDRVAHLASALQSGRSLEEVARETGHSVRELELLSAFAAVSRAEATRAAARRRWKTIALAAVATVGAVALVSREALAQACAQTLPAPMVTFCPDSPALANVVNANFQQLATWLQEKVGPLGSSNVAITGSLTVSAPDGGPGTVTINGSPVFGGTLTVDGGITFAGGLRQALTLGPSASGIGAQLNTTYFRSPSAFAWYRGGVHNDAQWNAGGGQTSMQLTGTGELISQGLFQQGPTAPQPYEVSSTRLVVEAGPSNVGVVVPIDSAALDNLCRDVDGCPFTISMVNWTGDGRVATRSGTLFLTPTNSTWRLEVAGGDFDGSDGDNGTNEYSAWDCYFTDAHFSTGTNNNRVDNGAGFGLLNCRGCTYNDALTSCRLVFRD
ncbi:MAG: hypothetical protein INH41_10035 [Myxococcaceae bacterium]|nr:hypothetical protein [Myxococcaceae bacterium]